jgi:hypothetical protein
LDPGSVNAVVGAARVVDRSRTGSMLRHAEISQAEEVGDTLNIKMTLFA